MKRFCKLSAHRAKLLKKSTIKRSRDLWRRGLLYARNADITRTA